MPACWSLLDSSDRTSGSAGTARASAAYSSFAEAICADAALARGVPAQPEVRSLASSRLQLAGFSIDRHAKPSYLKLR